MSCNGCRALRKGCSDSCVLRQSLREIQPPQAQSNATVFVARFFGRSDLLSFISAVPQSQRPSLFQSLLYEACGRTVNPVSGAVGLLCSGNWHLCQAAVDAVLAGDPVRPIHPDLLARVTPTQPPEYSDGASDAIFCGGAWTPGSGACLPSIPLPYHSDLALSPAPLQPPTPPLPRFSSKIRGGKGRAPAASLVSTDQSVTTAASDGEQKLLNLFV